MATITAATHGLCVNQQDEIVFSAWNVVMLFNIKDNGIVEVEITDALVKEFPILSQYWDNTGSKENDGTESTTHSQTSKNFKASWSRPSILQLIGFYKDNISGFADTSIKNCKIWNLISEWMKAAGLNFSATQCQDKFKYLKAQYTKQVDNMSNTKCSGAAPFKFEYFDEMDEIFGKKPNIRPQHIASSSRRSSGNTTDDTTEEPPQKKKKKVVSDEWLDLQRLNAKERAKRHQEKIAIQQKALETFSTAVDRLLDKLE